MMAGDLQADRADNLSIGGFNHLKFGQPLFQFTRREAHGIPKRFQALKIVRCGAADAEIGWAHRRSYTKSASPIATGADGRAWISPLPQSPGMQAPVSCFFPNLCHSEQGEI
jgi:hypothetical protein